ncbi:hypothetical protein [Cyclobacterium plantarum]|uniref:Uncharacterized protein n=1 Tax=Cyclobacterium plantarum TaxID=2716263 RepID=A0ABX0H8D4_9BACT|nr:hypothetical protein [Cyclobacterium plantarum]NHE57867.1 hypothetical protein [Cyclobacterium plantarum]
MSENRLNRSHNLKTGLSEALFSFLLLIGFLLTGVFSTVFASQEGPEANGENETYVLQPTEDSGNFPNPFPLPHEPEPENSDESGKKEKGDDESSKWATATRVPECLTHNLTRGTFINCLLSLHNRRTPQLYVLHHSWKRHLS